VLRRDWLGARAGTKYRLTALIVPGLATNVTVTPASFIGSYQSALRNEVLEPLLARIESWAGAAQSARNPKARGCCAVRCAPSTSGRRGTCGNHLSGAAACNRADGAEDGDAEQGGGARTARQGARHLRRSRQQVRDKDADAEKLLGMMETIVPRGRVKGFIPWLITQRPAAVTTKTRSVRSTVSSR